MMMTGYFQSEKYFQHHRKRILKLFAPRSDDEAYIQSKYGALLNSPCTVGVQVRLYWEDAEGGSSQSVWKRLF